VWFWKQARTAQGERRTELSYHCPSLGAKVLGIADEAVYCCSLLGGSSRNQQALVTKM